MYGKVKNDKLALKSQFIEVFDETYFRGLRNQQTVFFGVLYLQMIIHLYDNYGMITAVDIIQNEKKMGKLYDPSETIETFFDLIEDAVEFAKAGNSSFTSTHIVTKAFIQMIASGLYKDKCRRWNQLLVHARTFLVFKAIFLTINKEIREI